MRKNQIISVHSSKGQLISKGLFGVFKSTKKKREFFLIDFLDARAEILSEISLVFW